MSDCGKVCSLSTFTAADRKFCHKHHVKTMQNRIVNSVIFTWSKRSLRAVEIKTHPVKMQQSRHKQNRTTEKTQSEWQPEASRQRPNISVPPTRLTLGQQNTTATLLLALPHWALCRICVQCAHLSSHYITSLAVRKSSPWKMIRVNLWDFTDTFEGKQCTVSSQ